MHLKAPPRTHTHTHIYHIYRLENIRITTGCVDLWHEVLLLLLFASLSAFMICCAQNNLHTHAQAQATHWGLQLCYKMHVATGEKNLHIKGMRWSMQNDDARIIECEVDILIKRNYNFFLKKKNKNKNIFNKNFSLSCINKWECAFVVLAATVKRTTAHLVLINCYWVDMYLFFYFWENTVSPNCFFFG